MRGVVKVGNRFRAGGTFNGKYRNIGHFATEQEAHAAFLLERNNTPRKKRSRPTGAGRKRKIVEAYETPIYHILDEDEQLLVEQITQEIAYIDKLLETKLVHTDETDLLVQKSILESLISKMEYRI